MVPSTTFPKNFRQASPEKKGRKYFLLNNTIFSTQYTGVWVQGLACGNRGSAVC